MEVHTKFKYDEHDLFTKVDMIISKNREEIINFLKKLILTKSITGSRGEGEAQELVKEKLEKVPTIELDVWEPDPKEFEKYPLKPIFLKPANYIGRPNVVGMIKGTGGGKSLVLNGHIDTVSPEPIGLWTKNPWSGFIHGGKLYGRGSADMKAGITVIVYIVKILNILGIKLKGDLIVQSVVEEEFGGGGSLSAMLRGYIGDAVIITEPSGVKNLCIGWNGSRYFIVNIYGRPAIANRAHEGINAIALACQCYHTINNLGKNRLKKLSGKHPLFEKIGNGLFYGGGEVTNLIMGILKAGDWPNTVAAKAQLMGRVGFPPSETGEEVKSQIEEAILRLAKKDIWNRAPIPKIEWYGPQREGDILSDNEKLVLELRKSIIKVFSEEPDLFASPTTGDITYFYHKINGYGGIPSIMYGPGGGNAHNIDEYVFIDEIFDCIKILINFIINWCGISSIEGKRYEYI